MSHQGSLSGHCKAVNCVRFSPTGDGSRYRIALIASITLAHKPESACRRATHRAQAATLPALGMAGSSSYGSLRKAPPEPLAQSLAPRIPAGSWRPASGMHMQPDHAA